MTVTSIHAACIMCSLMHHGEFLGSIAFLTPCTLRFIDNLIEFLNTGKGQGAMLLEIRKNFLTT